MCTVYCVLEILQGKGTSDKAESGHNTILIPKFTLHLLNIIILGYIFNLKSLWMKVIPCKAITSVMYILVYLYER